MTMTPEDVANKRFQTTKYRPGYDQDEVDDFLDEVVVELRHLSQAGDSLRQRLGEGESRLADMYRSVAAAEQEAVQRSANEAQAAEQDVARMATAQEAQREEARQQAAREEAARQEVARQEAARQEAARQEAARQEVLRQDTLRQEAARQEAVRQSAQAPVPLPSGAIAGLGAGAAGVAAAAASTSDESATTNLLQLARRLHEEHVREGAERRDKIITEANTTAARIVASAEAKQRQVLAALDEERATVERKIEELRGFEREYRRKLRDHIEAHLRDLDSRPQRAGTPVAQPVSQYATGSHAVSTPGFGD